LWVFFFGVVWKGQNIVERVNLVGFLIGQNVVLCQRKDDRWELASEFVEALMEREKP
jgi:hypothetical protein